MRAILPEIAAMKGVLQPEQFHPEGDVFVHGEAYAVRELRRHLRGLYGLAPEWTSISGYWRRGDTEDGWQSTKQEWNAQIEAEEAPAPA